MSKLYFFGNPQYSPFMPKTLTKTETAEGISSPKEVSKEDFKIQYKRRPKMEGQEPEDDSFEFV
jgi:hypothetical protein